MALGVTQPAARRGVATLLRGRGIFLTPLISTSASKTTAARPLSQTVRFYSSQKPPSQHIKFYKTFGRPVFKVFLMAMFTYQVLYLGWVKLEHAEERVEKQAEVDELEEKVKLAQAQGEKKA